MSTTKNAKDALYEKLESLLPDGESIRTTPQGSKMPGIFLSHPKGHIDTQEIERLAKQYNPHLTVRYNPTPVQNKKTGQWYDPSLFVGAGFAKATKEDIFDILDSVQ